MYFFVKLDDRKPDFKTFDAKNSIFSHISPSFIGAGAPCPHPHRSMKAYYKHERRNYDDLVSLCLSFSFHFSFFFSFLSFPFTFSPLFFFFGGGGGPGPAAPPDPCLIESFMSIYGLISLSYRHDNLVPGRFIGTS